MARDLPDTFQLREIKYGSKTTASKQVATARALLAAGRVAEALDLFLLAGDDPGIAEVRSLALERGRPVLLLMLRRAGKEVDAKEWSAAGAAAFKDHRWREAFRCYSEAEDEDGVAKVLEKLPGYEIYTPQGK